VIFVHPLGGVNIPAVERRHPSVLGGREGEFGQLIIIANVDLDVNHRTAIVENSNTNPLAN